MLHYRGNARSSMYIVCIDIIDNVQHCTLYSLCMMQRFCKTLYKHSNYSIHAVVMHLLGEVLSSLWLPFACSDGCRQYVTLHTHTVIGVSCSFDLVDTIKNTVMLQYFVCEKLCFVI